MKLSIILAFIFSLFPSYLFAEERFELQIKPPPAWSGWKQTGSFPSERLKLDTLVPANAFPGSLKDLITVTHTWGDSQADAPFRLTNAWAQHLATSCPNLSVVPPKLKDEGVFSVAYAQFFCPKRSDSNEGSMDFAKVISTNNSAVLVVIAQRTSSYTNPVPGPIQYEDNAETIAFVEWLKSASDYLSSVHVCLKDESGTNKKCSP
ncbi:MAG: hypothetical protein SFU55_08475 [Methylophilus sp.]|nr:hypothetical protein [Methylophilus sp.]